MDSNHEAIDIDLAPKSCVNGGPSNEAVPTKKPRRHTSFVWDHFEKIKVDELTKAKCLHCNSIYTAGSKSETSHLKDHLENRCTRKNKKVDIRQKILSMNRKIDGGASLNASNFNQEVSRKELANMVIMHEYPLSMVDHIGFRRFVSSINPSFKVMSRNTLRSDIMKMFLSEKASLKKLLGINKSKIAITTDMWTASNQKRGYMVVTAHYIDESWVLDNKTLRFAYVPCPHTKDALAQVLLDTMNVYHISEKIVSIVVDNCSTNDAMLDVIRLRLGHDFLILKGRMLHMRCTAHILNLIVQDGLDVIGEGTEKVRDCVSFWVATPKRMEMFEDKVKSMKGEQSRKISQYCKTMWNSTFLMLQSVLPYKDVFSMLKRHNPRLKFTLPPQEDWELAELVCEKLDMFHKLIEVFSDRKYPTSNLFFCNVCEIKIALTSWKNSEIIVIRDMAEKMMKKYDKYWSTINEILAIAAILDPRNKLECVDFYFTKIYGIMADLEIERVKDTFYALMLEYEDTNLSTEEFQSSAAQANVHQGDNYLGVANEWSILKKTKRGR